MKKLLAFLLLCCSFAIANAQFNAVAVVGSDGYSVARASYNMGVPFVPGLGIVPQVSMYSRDDMDTMYKYGLGLNWQTPFLDILEIGAEGFYTPKKNDYSNYSLGAYASLDIAHFMMGVMPMDTLKIGAGVRKTFHTFYYSPDVDINETDIYTFIRGAKGGLDLGATYTKAIDYSPETGVYQPLWLDIPGLNAVYGGFLDYSLSVDAGYTYKIVRPYASYSLIKLKGFDETDDLRLGLTLKLAVVNVNGAVEWYNFSKNSGQDRERFYTLNASLGF
jgi:hypothetical protein